MANLVPQISSLSHDMNVSCRRGLFRLKSFLDSSEFISLLSSSGWFGLLSSSIV